MNESMAHCTARVASLTALVLVGAGRPPAGLAGPSRLTLATPLLRPASVVQEPMRPDDPTVVRSRRVSVNPNVLAQWQTLETDATLRFDLFDDVVFHGEVDQVTRRTAERFLVSGRLSGGSGGTFTVSVNHGVMAANIRAPGKGSYQIRYAGDGLHSVREIDESKFPPCGTGPEDALPAPGQAAQMAPAAEGCPDDGSVIDLMVVYTTVARLSIGGTEAMETLIDLAEFETNDAYLNSQITSTRVRVVLTHETDYSESGSSSTDRARLSNPGDGFMDEVIALRDQVAADVVTLMVNNFEVCGRAYFSIQSENTPFPELGFNVVKTLCATGNYTFGHELAHNQGCRHDRLHDNSDGGAFLYSHGYIHPGNTFRTVMGVVTSGVRRIRYFSNPDVLYNGLPTGIAPGDANSAHNALTIANTAFNVANFRPSRDCNRNGVCDGEEVDAGLSPDCNLNGRPDECEEDCNGTGQPDQCDVVDGTSADCNRNLVPDECEEDCNNSGQPDDCDIAQGASEDCTGDGVPDECEADCNANDQADSCDIGSGISEDANGNSRPDECEPPILYVDASATGKNIGVGWADAFRSPHDAFAIAADSSGAVKEVWIAVGIYKPAPPGGDRTVSFQLPLDVGVYGGFSGWETSRDQRDRAANVTVFSGDLNGDDGPDFTNMADNSHHVLFVEGFVPKAGLETVLDGFTVTSGNASSEIQQGSERVGGGLLAKSVWPTVANCLFSANLAVNGGAAGFIGSARGVMHRCSFVGNKCDGAGGAINASSIGRVEVRDSLFHGNRASHGGAVAAPRGVATLNHCTFVENHADFFGGAAYSDREGGIHIDSSLFWGNTAGELAPTLYIVGTFTDATVAFSNVEGGAAGLTVETGATLEWGLGNIDADPLFDTDGFHLLPGSPCIGRGNPERARGAPAC